MIEYHCEYCWKSIWTDSLLCKSLEVEFKTADSTSPGYLAYKKPVRDMSEKELEMERFKGTGKLELQVQVTVTGANQSRFMGHICHDCVLTLLREKEAWIALRSMQGEKK